MSAEHLLHFHIDQYGVTVSLTCEHAPDDARWFPTDIEGDFGEPGTVLGKECWTIDWCEAESADTYLVGAWPDDPPSPCPVDCVWDDSLSIMCASSVFADRAAAPPTEEEAP